jgi:hypothetical protein
MPETVQAGTILIREWPGMPQLPQFETEPCSAEWTLVKAHDGFAVDRKIHAAGWNFFFMAGEMKASFVGSTSPAKIQSALKRILAKVAPHNFNSLEVTQIVGRHFLGVPYVTVYAHSRHVQQSCNLDSLGARKAAQNHSA